MINYTVRTKNCTLVGFASSYLNEFVTKRYKSVTFVDQVFFTVRNSINMSKIVRQLDLKL